MALMFWLIVMCCGFGFMFVPWVPGWVAGALMLLLANIGLAALHNQKKSAPKWCQCGDYDGE